MQARPQRPYRSFAEFCTKLNWLGLKLGPGEFPCLTCHGRRWMYDPDDPPCPVEGNKMRNTIKCDACEGTGRSTRKACAATYKEVIDRWKAEAAKYDRLKALREAGLNRLTAEQLFAIKELGL